MAGLEYILALILLVLPTKALIDLGECCDPDPSLEIERSDGSSANRAAWIRDKCHCLRDNRRVPGEVKKGQYQHYHWTLTNYTLINDPTGGFVTFHLIPCNGMPNLFAKPAILADGTKMNQLFEVYPEGHPLEGYQSETWPFPDNSTGVYPQGGDNRLQAPHLRSMKWGLNGTRSGYTNSVTFRIQHGGYFVSVYGEADSKYTIMAFTHTGPVNPLQQENSGESLSRRSSLSANWQDGKLKMYWNTTGAHEGDTYQLYMVVMLPDDSTKGIGQCGQDYADMYTDDPDPLIRHSSQCILWTACGVEANAMRVGNVLSEADLVNSRLSIDLARDDCHFPTGAANCKITKDTPYYFTVMRNSIENPDFKEIYLGIDTMSSYETVQQLQSDETIIAIGVGAGSSVLGLMLIIVFMKYQTQRQMFEIYKEAHQRNKGGFDELQ